MAVLKVLRVPNPVLKKKAQKIDVISDEIKTLADDMLETMYAIDGIGLAAPQVGRLVRLIVIDVKWRKDTQEKEPIIMINPEICDRSEELNTYCEGCLSVPGQYEEVTRPKRVTFKYTDTDGAEHKVEADGLLATAVQHETDHLEGKLFIDYLSPLKRNIIIRKVKKMGDRLYEPDDADENGKEE